MLTAKQYRHSAKVIAEDRNPLEAVRSFDAISGTRTGLRLDTGHCYYGGGDPAREAEKYKHLLRYVHINDIDRPFRK